MSFTAADAHLLTEGYWSTPVAPNAEEMTDNLCSLAPDAAFVPRDFPDKPKWTQFQSVWFDQGIEAISEISPKKGIDGSVAFARLSVIQSSLLLDDDHKAIAVPWLASLWLDDWTPAQQEATH